MSVRNVHPQLGADELLLRVGERFDKLRLPFFMSDQLAMEHRLTIKLCSDTLGRLYRRGDLIRERLTRKDRLGTSRGICFRYRISRKGENRLRYLRKRQSIYSVYSAVSGPLETRKLNMLRPFLKEVSTSPDPKSDFFRTKPMLSFLTIIDEEILAALPGLVIMAKNKSQASAILNHLHYRGLACQELSDFDVSNAVINAKTEGLSDEEIIFNALFKSILWFKKENESLKEENRKLELQLIKRT